MDAQSPPKRMTRARAAAKTSEPAAKPTRVVTAAAKAKAVRSTPASAPARPALKRKSPSDEDEDDLEMQPAKKMTATATKPTRGRGRPKKVAAEESAPEPAPEPVPAPTVRTRGRPKKVAEPPAEEPVKATRTTRTKKTAAQEAETAAELDKTTIRSRSAISSTATTKTTAKPTVKKTVKFEEPEKENMVPAAAVAKKTSTKAAAPAPTTGLRGKPVRRAASASAPRAARGTRAATGTAESNEKVEKPMPLSPKKVNQLTMNRVESDDELGMDEKVPVRRFKKAPIKPVTGSTKSASVAKNAISVPLDDENAAPTGWPETEINHMLATPAKRLPPSPWKGSIRSPAKRVEGLIVASVTQIDGQSSQVPSRVGLLQSPAKRQPLGLNPHGADSLTGTAVSPVKLSFLSSPAKRPPLSPIKPLPRSIEEEDTLSRTPAPKPTLLASPLPRAAPSSLEEALAAADEVVGDMNTDDEAIPESPTRLSFPGRLSAVLPRHADPALTPPTMTVPEQTSEIKLEQDTTTENAEEDDEVECLGEPMIVETPVEPSIVESTSTTPTSSPPKLSNPIFGLREKDLYDQAADSESDDESPVRKERFTSAFSTLPATPCPAPARTSNPMQSAARSTAKKGRMDDKCGLTPLAQQLSGWTAGPSPLKTGLRSGSPCIGSATAGRQEQDALPEREAAPTPLGPAQNTFFEDAMHIQPETMEVEEDAATVLADSDEPVLEDLSFTEEDMELAAEAHEMSLVEKDADAETQDHDDSISEASQEYADENAIPIDPSLTAFNGFHAPAGPPVTPQRVVHREFHTVAKVPLKAADDSTPRPKLEKRSHSVSRPPVTRPTERLTRNATVISYSPTKGSEPNVFEDEFEEHTAGDAPVTPQKADIWSTIGTPARTPRRDLNPALLRGAVVFVDVHTSEGADASSIFVELLTQMGARCVKTWAWNPNSSSESGADSRVGITHVVYKDGGKRTMEKVRESGGVVQCVGVSWVLE